MGHTTIHAGRILFEGSDISVDSAVARARLGIALVPEGRRPFVDLNVEENLTVGGYSRSAARDAINRGPVSDVLVQRGIRLFAGEQKLNIVFGEIERCPREIEDIAGFQFAAKNAAAIRARFVGNINESAHAANCGLRCGSG